jgi:hypothetical protein
MIGLQKGLDCRNFSIVSQPDVGKIYLDVPFSSPWVETHAIR